MNKKTLFVGVMSLLTLGNAYAYSTYPDLTYGEKERNQLDLYLPDDVKNPPLVIFVHGGRWLKNDKSQIELYKRVEKLTDAGFAIASINWTYSSQAIWPAQIDDVNQAMSYLEQNASKLGYNYDSVAIWGQSSGAHMALWGGLLSTSGKNKAVDAIVSWYAPSDLYSIALDRRKPTDPEVTGKDLEKAPESLVLGKNTFENKEDADAASPLHYIKNLPVGKPLPPFLLVHGTADSIVPMVQTERLHQAIIDQGGAKRVEVTYIEGGKHGGEGFEQNVDQVVSFLKQELQED